MNRNSSDLRCDLHLHSDYSDSDTTVDDCFKQAKEAGLKCISVTDHDTLEAVEAARQYSKQYGVELLEGIELSADYEDAEVHILGYLINCDDPKLLDELVHIKELRQNRIIDMAQALLELGFKVDVKELMAGIGQMMPTRLHLGLYMLEKGMVSSLPEAFKKYLSPGKPAYRARFKQSVKGIVDLIKKHQGFSFVAHPHTLHNQQWVDELIALGVDGLEVVYPNMSPEKRSKYDNLVKKHNLLRSGGSDAHGAYKKFTHIGKVTVPYQWVEEMKARKQALKTA